MSIFDFAIIRKTQRDVSSRAADLVSQIQALEAERKAIQEAPVTRKEVAALVPSVVRNLAEKFESECHETIRLGLMRPGDCNQDRADHLFRGLVFPHTSPARDRENISAAAVCALFGSIAEERLQAIIGAMDWPADSAPMDGRQEKIDAITQKIGDLTGQHRELMEQARAAGLDL